MLTLGKLYKNSDPKEKSEIPIKRDPQVAARLLGNAAEIFKREKDKLTREGKESDARFLQVFEEFDELSVAISDMQRIIYAWRELVVRRKRLLKGLVAKFSNRRLKNSVG